MTARKSLILVAALFLAYLAITLLGTGWSKHQQDGRAHLDLFIGGAVFGVIALAGVAQALGITPNKNGKGKGRTDM